MNTTITATVSSGGTISSTIQTPTTTVKGTVTSGAPGPAGATGATGPAGPTGPAGSGGVVAGGTLGQVLTKASSTDYDTKWDTPYYVNVKDYGATGDGTTDDTTALQNAINATHVGGICFLPQGIYATTAPLTIPPGVTIMGTHANHTDNTSGFTDMATYIQPKATFSGAACLLMVDKEVGSYAKDSCEQRIFNITLDGTNIQSLGGSIDGIQAKGLVHGVVIRDVCVRYFSAHGIFTTFYTRLDSSVVNPYSWRMERVLVDTCGTYGLSLNNMTDATLIDVEGFGCSSSGFYLAGMGNSNFIGCRAEWNLNYGFEVHTGGNFNASMFTSCTTDSNTKNGFYVTDAGGTQPVIFNSIMCHRDGRNGGTGGGGYAGFFVDTCAAPVIINGLTVSCGVDDTGAGTTHPQYGARFNSATYVSVTSSFLHGNTAGWQDDGTNTILRRGPNVGEQTGTWNSPTNVYQNNWGTDSGSQFTAALNGADQVAINIKNTAANLNSPLINIVTGSATSDLLVKSKVTGDTNTRYALTAGGLMTFGPGNTSSDTNLYRSGVGILTTDTAFTSGTTINATTGFLNGGAATTGNVLRGNGTVFVSAALAAADLSNGVQGSGAVVLATSPTLTTPILGVATATSINKVAITAPATSATLTIANAKTLTVNNSLTLAGTDTTTMTFPSTSATIARTDAAQTFTGAQTFTSPVINGASSGTGVSTTGAASTLALRDANGNIAAISNILGFATTATAGGTSTLTAASSYNRLYTGTLTQTIVLPATSTLSTGQSWLLMNASTGAVTVQSSGLNNVIILAPGTAAIVTCIVASGTTAASWQAVYFGSIAATGKSLTTNNILTLAGTDGTTMTFPSTSDTVMTLTATQTVTNKRVTKRVATVTQSATPAINTDITDVASITGLAQAITSMTTSLTGTPVDGDTLVIRLTDNGTARAITWGTSFEASTVALPTTTVVSTMLMVGFMWNTATSKWRVIAVA